LGAYFAYQVDIWILQLFGAYAKPLGLYYSVCAFTFVVFLAVYLEEVKLGLKDVLEK
jgi:hypothetical protein